jgi:CemA family
MTELEKIGLIPRSIVRMLDRFYYQIYLGTAEPLVKQFRFSKYLLLTSVKSLFVVLFIPFFINIFTKIYVFRPLVEYFWDRKQTEIFLNYELQEKAFSEIRNFEEKMYFDYLIKTENFFPEKPKYFTPEAKLPGDERGEKNKATLLFFSSLPMQKNELFGVNLQKCKFKTNQPYLNSYSVLANSSSGFENGNCLKLSLVSLSADKYPIKFTVIKNDLFYSALNLPSLSSLRYSAPQIQNLGFNSIDQNKFYFVSFPNSIETLPYNFNKNTESIFRQKTRELANHYNNESISAITNLLADFMGLLILLFLLVNMKMSLMNTTAFLSESFFSLKDSKKAFLMLLFTDLLVGFHSPRGWEVIFHFLFEHFGLPENHNIIFLLVGTFPVLLDALFKYWIFRHLNRHSPATVATFQAMVE